MQEGTADKLLFGSAAAAAAAMTFGDVRVNHTFPPPWVLWDGLWFFVLLFGLAIFLPELAAWLGLGTTIAVIIAKAPAIFGKGTP